MKDTLNALTRKLPILPLYIAGLLYPAWLFWQGLTGGLGVDPVKTMEHAMGEAALQLLILSLLITPLRRFTGITLLRFRRMIGVMTFVYVLVHLLVWLVLDVQLLSQIWADILKRPYITVGMAGFILMIPLALTSNNWSTRKLGAQWRKLHRATYLIGILGGLHYVMVVKGFQIEPLIYLAVVVLSLLARIRPAKAKRVA
jgi:sulfoxide reductase heme-binding subunit YedZ